MMLDSDVGTDSSRPPGPIIDVRTDVMNLSLRRYPEFIMTLGFNPLHT